MSSRQRVLIVEDERTLRRALVAFLRSKEIEVSEAGSLVEARAWLARGSFDVVVLDVGLPDGDGLSLLAAVGAQRSLVMSATPDPLRFAECGVRHHLAKPVDLQQLLCAVQGLARASAARHRDRPPIRPGEENSAARSVSGARRDSIV
jgi:DNA-binding response OmpR family regulator